MNPTVRNMKKTSKLKTENTNLDNVHSDGLYCMTVLQCMVQYTQNSLQAYEGGLWPTKIFSF